MSLFIQRLKRLIKWYLTTSGLVLLLGLSCLFVAFTLNSNFIIGLIGFLSLAAYVPYRSIRERKQTNDYIIRLEKKIAAFSQGQQLIQEELKQLSVLNGSSYLPFNRKISDEAAHSIAEYWSDRLSIEIQSNEIRYLERRAIYIEGTLFGRVATTSTDIVIRSLLAQSIIQQGRRFELLEIGTLFGLGSSMIYDSLISKNIDCNLTLIDPLDGYYGGNALDPITGLIASEKLLHRNFNKLSIPHEEIILHKGLSTDKEIVEATHSDYDLILIDGDHSYEGIKSDYELYAGKVRTGGIILIDDYQHSSVWPGVKRYTDETIRFDERFEFIGAQSRTAAFRRL